MNQETKNNTKFLFSECLHALWERRIQALLVLCIVLRESGFSSFTVYIRGYKMYDQNISCYYYLINKEKNRSCHFLQFHNLSKFFIYYPAIKKMKISTFC